MNPMTGLKENLAGYLRGRPGLETADILIAWPPRRHLPLKAPAITVGLESVDLAPAGLGGYLGRGQRSEELYGSGAIITMRLDLFAPAREAEEAPSGGLYALYEALCAALTKNAGSLGLTRVWCDAPGWDDSANAHRMTARASLRAAVTLPELETAGSADLSSGFTDFRVCIQQ